MSKLWLTTVVGKAVLVVTAAWFGVALLGLKLDLLLSPAKQGIMVVCIGVLLLGLAAWWVYQSLKARFPKPEARSLAVAFTLFTPVAFAAGMLFAELSGGFADSLLGTPWGLLGAFAGAVVMTTSLDVLALSFASWLKHHP